MSQSKHGGPGRNQGRKLGPWGKRRLLSIKCTDAELERIKTLGTRERAEALLVAILFDELHDALEGVQLCDNTADEAERAWTEISSIVGEFKGKAVAALPVSQIQAMAALTAHYNVGPYGVYYVPENGGGTYTIRREKDGLLVCECQEGIDCDHIKAVEMYLAQQGAK